MSDALRTDIAEIPDVKKGSLSNRDGCVGLPVLGCRLAAGTLLLLKQKKEETAKRKVRVWALLVAPRTERLLGFGAKIQKFKFG